MLSLSSVFIFNFTTLKRNLWVFYEIYWLVGVIGWINVRKETQRSAVREKEKERLIMINMLANPLATHLVCLCTDKLLFFQFSKYQSLGHDESDKHESYYWRILGWLFCSICCKHQRALYIAQFNWVSTKEQFCQYTKLRCKHKIILFLFLQSCRESRNWNYP